MSVRGEEFSKELSRLRSELDAIKTSQKFDPTAFRGSFYKTSDPNDYWARLSLTNDPVSIEVEFTHNSGRIQFLEMAHFFRSVYSDNGSLNQDNLDVLANPFPTQVILGTHEIVSVKRLQGTSTTSKWRVDMFANDLFINQDYIYIAVKFLFYGTDTGTFTITEI